MEPTNTEAPEYFHKVVDCQWACPAHTPVPEYIRLIAAGRYTDAYMVNWKSNVFPGILGRTCDRPCEPACRRGRVDEEPVAICRLKRVAAYNKDDISTRLPLPPAGSEFLLADADLTAEDRAELEALLAPSPAPGAGGRAPGRPRREGRGRPSRAARP